MRSGCLHSCWVERIRSTGILGITDPKVELSNFSNDGIRKVLVQQNAQIKEMVVLIKPSDESKYKNVVDILDEMNISNIARFALVDITPVDEGTH